MTNKYITLRHPKTSEWVCILPQLRSGYPGWKEVAKHTEPPHPHACWVDGQGYVVDDDQVAAQAEAARLQHMSRAEFMAEVDAKLEQLVARIKLLEAGHNGR